MRWDCGGDEAQRTATAQPHRQELCQLPHTRKIMSQASALNPAIVYSPEQASKLYIAPAGYLRQASQRRHPRPTLPSRTVPGPLNSRFEHTGNEAAARLCDDVTARLSVVTSAR